MYVKCVVLWTVLPDDDEHLYESINGTTTTDDKCNGGDCVYDYVRFRTSSNAMHK